MKRDLPIQPQTREEQYAADLEALSRIEEEIVAQGGSPADLEFFSEMGQRIQERCHG